MTEQPTLFDQPQTAVVSAETIVLFALGEFQARKKELIGRELPLDRLMGAFRRAAEKLETDELSDEALASELQRLGAKIKRLQPFRAKHPFLITVNDKLAAYSLQFYQDFIVQQKAKV